jgi:hypothetical protein
MSIMAISVDVTKASVTLFVLDQRRFIGLTGLLLYSWTSTEASREALTDLFTIR